MADNYTFKDAAGATKTHASEDLGGDVHVSKHVSVDDAGVMLAKAEDAAHVSGDKGFMLLAVRKDSAAALAGTDGDYIPLIVDGNGRLHVSAAVGAAAHDAANIGNPVKIGGVVRETFGGSDINGNDVGDLRMDRYQRIYVVPTGDAAGSNSTSPPRVYARPEAGTLILKPSDPAPSGTDIVDDANNAIVAGDLTIRDTDSHYFIIPMAAANYRSCTIFLQNGTSTWDQTIAVHIFSAFQDGSAFLHFGRLLSFTLSTNANTRFSIGTNNVSSIGGTAGADPSGAAGFAHYSVPAISDGWPVLALRLQASVAPTQGEIQRLVISRMRF